MEGGEVLGCRGADEGGGNMEILKHGKRKF